MKTDLSRYDNSWYYPGRGFVIRAFWFVTNALFFLNPLFSSSGLKVFLLKLFGAKIGRGVVIKPGVNIKYPWHLSIGDYSWIGERVWVDSLGKVEIGANCCLSQGALLLCGNHNYKKPGFDLEVGTIVLEEGVWIGSRAVVTGGSVCCSHSVLGVQSVAPRVMEAFTVYRGNPALVTQQRVIEEKS